MKGLILRFLKAPLLVNLNRTEGGLFRKETYTEDCNFKVFVCLLKREVCVPSVQKLAKEVLAYKTKFYPDDAKEVSRST